METEAIDRLLKAALIRREKWNEAPELGTVYRSKTGVLRIAPWDIDPKVWRPDTIATFLNRTAEKLGEQSPQQRRRGLSAMLPDGALPLGVYFRAEIVVVNRSHGEELYRRAAAGGSLPAIDEMPGSRLARSIYAAMFDGPTRAVVQDNDASLQPPRNVRETGGEVLNALKGIAKSLAVV